MTTGAASWGDDQVDWGTPSNRSPDADTLRELLAKLGTTPVAGVFNPLSALIAEQVGFQALYFSGAAFSASLGIPDIGLFTLNELSTAVQWVTRATRLPLIVDADTGFGEAINVYRTVSELESAGASAIQIEDQVMPKRCGHLDGKQIISREAFSSKLRAASEARTSALIVARTDSKAVLGMDEAVHRGRLARSAGADIIFPEALESAPEFRRYAAKVEGPLLANMTEFGKTPYLSIQQFRELGYQLVIFPVTSLRVAAKAIRSSLQEVLDSGTQRHLLDAMQTRADLYDLIGYDDYERLDRRFSRGD